MAADYRPEGNLAAIVPILKASHDKRISHDQDFKYLQEDIAEFDKMREKNLISLNEADRRKLREAQESRDRDRDRDDKSRSASAKTKRVFQDDGMLSSERNLSADLAIDNANRNAKDILLNEAAHVISDEAGLLLANPRLAENIPQ